jgi:hypothetical protein
MFKPTVGQEWNLKISIVAQQCTSDDIRTKATFGDCEKAWPKTQELPW